MNLLIDENLSPLLVRWANEMCAEMVAEDLKAAQRHALLKAHGHEVAVAQER